MELVKGRLYKAVKDPDDREIDGIFVVELINTDKDTYGGNVRIVINTTSIYDYMSVGEKYYDSRIDEDFVPYGEEEEII